MNAIHDEEYYRSLIKEKDNLLKSGKEQCSRISVLGTLYSVLEQTEEENPRLAGKDGYTDISCKKIVTRMITDAERSDPDTVEVPEECMKKVLRHEIIHAFLHESGLDCQSVESEVWAHNEEMVDWMAIQMPKIIEAFKEAGCI